MKTIKKDQYAYLEHQLESNTLFGKDIKYGMTNFYVIKHKDGERITDIYIENKNNARLNLYARQLLIPYFLEAVLYELSKDYESIQIEIDKFDDEINEIVKSKSKVINVSEREFESFTNNVYTIDLKEINNDIPNNFKITKESYESYLEIMEERIKESTIYKEIKLGKSNYYEIYDNENELIDTFLATNNGNEIDIYLKDDIAIIPGVLKSIGKELVNDYDSIVFNTFNTSTNAINAIKENFKNVEDVTKDIINKIGLINIKVNLK